MKRILAIVLVGVMGVIMTTGDASAWRRRYRYRSHHGHQGYRHYGYYGYRPRYYYPRRHYYGRRRYDYQSSAESGRSHNTYAGGGGQVLGGILGGIGGGVIGSQIGRGRGRVGATIAGSVIGLLVGSEIGRQLDERERITLARTTNETLEKAPSGTEVPWRDPDSGTHGTVTPKRAYKNAEGRNCREYQQTVTISGETKSAHGTACRQPDGTWKLVPSR